LTHVGHKDRAKGSLSGQFQVNSYPCSKQLGAWSYAGVCTHAPTSGGRVIGVDGVSDINALHSGKHNGKVQLCAFDVLALDGDDYLDALPRLRFTFSSCCCAALGPRMRGVARATKESMMMRRSNRPKLVFCTERELFWKAGLHCK
jgi:hypothetical protein